MIFLTSIILVTLAFNSLSISAQETFEIGLGEVKNESEQVIYFEKHKSRFIDGKLIELKTTYFQKNQKPFGSVTSNFSKTRYIPDHQFEDTRFGQKDSLQKKGDKYYVLSIPTKDSKTNQFEVTPEEGTVSGQGFHTYLRDHLNQFIKDPSLKIKVRFLVPTKNKTYTFRLRHLKTNVEQKTITLRFEANSWFLRFVAPRIDVRYNYENKRLLMYSGPSNIKNKKGKDENVIINYTYPAKIQKKGTS